MTVIKFRELQKKSKENVEGKQIRVAVLGNCSTQFFSQAIEGYGKLSGINISVFDADYNQIDAQLLDSASEVFSFDPDIVVIWLCTEKLYEDFLRLDIDSRSGFADRYVLVLEKYWNLVSRTSTAKIIQPNFTEIDDKVLGHFSEKVPSAFTYQIRKLNYLLEENISTKPGVFPVDFLSVQIEMGRENYYDSRLYYSSKIPVSMNALPRIAKAVNDVITAMNGKVIKCAILDLDNTLWGGVIGDDGLSGIEIGELGKGHVYSNLQLWLKQLKEYGIILAICSKNNEDIAREPFEKHEEMVLKLSDISVFVANWEDKASNIKLIQDSLNIGMDSIIFLDDNPFERNLVKEKIPDLVVPDLPDDPSKWLDYLQHENYFETASYTSEIKDRTALYQAEFERKKLEHNYESIDDYLESLQMIGAAKPFEPLRYPRIAQLTQRSNQFNLRTIRYTEDDIQRIAEDDEHVTLYYTLKDRFGDHGLVSVVIMKRVDSETLFVDTWLMSCRVLKRGMEEFVVNKIVKTAADKGITTLTAEYIPTPKNKMVKDIYKTMGFKEIKKGKYVLNVNDYTEKNTFIVDEDEADN